MCEGWVSAGGTEVRGRKAGLWKRVTVRRQEGDETPWERDRRVLVEKKESGGGGRIRAALRGERKGGREREI